MDKNKKVLIVEDERRWQELLAETIVQLGRLPIEAMTVKEGERLFRENPDVVAILMDACVPGDTPTTVSLVRKIRDEMYRGPIVAMSSVLEYRELLVVAGCSHQCDKSDLLQRLPEILNG